MVKLTGPFMSMGASGTLGGILTAAKWKGRAYARTRVIPSNPRLPLQVSNRAMFKFLSQEWEGIGSTPKGTWEDDAKAAQYLPFNAYMAANMRLYREFSSPSQTNPNPATGTEPVAVLTSAVGGDSHMDITLTVTTLNDVWGVILFRSATGTFTPSRGNAIAVIPIAATGAHVWTDSNLAAGDYYYDAKFFTKEGVLGADEGEVTGTVT